MADSDKDHFLFPYRSYQGEVNLPNVIFDANLQEFSQRVGMICALENGGKVSPEEAYQMIKELWKKLKLSRQNILGTDQEQA
ncbi:DUF7219 family protein [Anthocerotibacter panamensis]|uniref:DUF7219 family protein n=1 Tax=Anthocerotibacter panamensis TaxID=2857077 RepID=UPI001C406E17|nr:hypothetical protein [Anthocerotibacter panamensis]